MKGIYLTEEAKKEIEAKIAELEIDLENHIQHCKMTGSDYDYQFEQGIEIYKEILSSATILPVEESWYKVIENVENDSQSLILQTPFIMKSLYKQGVIIKK
jgi:hypothetical protein